MQHCFAAYYQQITGWAHGRKHEIAEKVEGSEFEYNGPSIVELVKVVVVALSVESGGPGRKGRLTF